MNDLRPPIRRTVKTRALLAATGLTVVTFANCGSITAGNLLPPPTCNADGGPTNCYQPADAGNGDAGIGGDH